VANSFTGRQIIINATGVINIPCTFKVIECWWQDITAASQVFSFTDAAGRAYSFTSYSAGGTGFPPINIGKLDWLEGPITITAIGSGNVYMILGNK
jgi:hypothetical protein